ncbi:MAG: NADP-dependent isocitrate dehydrogenase [Cyclobacteriaceae bacterium]|nr:NADP-dependent isocitrate dehydrogenase [Cyclobacteriaceae bacterium]MCK5470346.1 NADP-dependent isocitrate dehydrogenase [Cyclobacteriaceae bacterium]
MSGKRKITVAYGDGIGPEIMQVTLDILLAAGAQIETEVIEIGEKVFRKGISTGIAPESWESIKKNKVFLKAPITTPQGGGFKSLNVATRTTLGLFANVRPCRSFFPYVPTNHPLTDMVIIRENEEDLYAGIEHQQTNEVVQALKLISGPGSEKIIRYAFEYAKVYGRKKVTCMTKDNIMKQVDGLFHKIFDEVAREYPEIENDHMIIDIGSAIIADRPHSLDVVVTENLYGDIISDIAAQVTGSVGLGGSSNIGEDVAMFEAIHGSAPDIAGLDIANPSGLINASCMMLVHINQQKAAENIKNAWLKTIEDGIHTTDIYNKDSLRKVWTQEFAKEVILRLGQEPARLRPVHYKEGDTMSKIKITKRPKAKKELVGVDVFLDWDENDRDPNKLGEILKTINGNGLKFSIITNRGVKVYPDGHPETFCSDHWRCRFVAEKDAETVTHDQILSLLNEVKEIGLDFIKTENLYTFDGEKGYSLAQGE